MKNSLRPFVAFPITTRFLHVVRTEDVTPGMRRIVLGGEQLKAHTAENGFPVNEFTSFGFDDEFKVLIKHPDAEVAVGPSQLDGVLDWPQDEHLLLRTYTVRRWDPEQGELTIDFVVHGLGPATSWARSAQVGDIMQIAGPKSSATHPEGADWVLAAGDETALPALGHWLEEWPAGQRGQFFIEVAEESHRQINLPHPEGVEITWLVRDGKPAQDSTLLFDAITTADWWDGKAFVWLAGEAGVLKPLRRWLRNEKNLSKEQLDITGYWRYQEVEASAENPGLQNLNTSKDPFGVFHDAAELTPGFALRVAATIGLGQALGTETRSLSELVELTHTDPAGLEKLLNFLSTIEMIDRTESGYKLTAAGSNLDEEFAIEALNLTMAQAHRELTMLLGLLDAVQDGKTTSYTESTPQRKQRLESENERAEYYASPLAGYPAFAEASSVAVSGQAAAGFGGVLKDKHPHLQVTVVAAPEDLDVIEIQDGLTTSTELIDADLVLLSENIKSLPGQEAVSLLQQANEHGRLLVFADVLDHETAGDHDYESDLAEFVLHGGGERTAAEMTRLFAEAGLNVPKSSSIGWGMTLYDFGA